MNMSHQKKLSVLAGVMLLLAIPPMWPYAYYQLLRWVVTGVALYNAYGLRDAQKKSWMFVMIGTAILFNPIAPLSFDKEVWAGLDIVVAIIMFVFRRSTQGNR